MMKTKIAQKMALAQTNGFFSAFRIPTSSLLMQTATHMEYGIYTAYQCHALPYDACLRQSVLHSNALPCHVTLFLLVFFIASQNWIYVHTAYQCHTVYHIYRI